MGKNFDAIAFKSDVEKLPFTTVYAMETPEDKLDIFNCLFLSCLDKHITTKFRERDRLRQSAHATKYQTAWNSFRNIRNEIKNHTNSQIHLLQASTIFETPKRSMEHQPSYTPSQPIKHRS